MADRMQAFTSHPEGDSRDNMELQQITLSGAIFITAMTLYVFSTIALVVGNILLYWRKVILKCQQKIMNSNENQQEGNSCVEDAQEGIPRNKNNRRGTSLNYKGRAFLIGKGLVITGSALSLVGLLVFIVFLVFLF
ncbi:hypothetical protein SK128_006855 [Halocaridina rubra]|uniref:Uncharacterized protein n=1 Tax=Halocaridina rubra TaxID=373956 RepID=A0AAN8WUI4_HALRR